VALARTSSQPLHMLQQKRGKAMKTKVIKNEIRFIEQDNDSDIFANIAPLRGKHNRLALLTIRGIRCPPPIEKFKESNDWLEEEGFIRILGKFDDSYVVEFLDEELMGVTESESVTECVTEYEREISNENE
jgi:hypothetical protein